MKNACVFRIRDVEGGEAGASRNERRDRFSIGWGIGFSEVKRSTGAKRTPEQARRRWGGSWTASRNAQIKNKNIKMLVKIY